MKSTFTLSLAFLLMVPCMAQSAETTLSLAGPWKFRLDAENVGVEEKWFAQTLDDTIQLPGTTDENRKGARNEEVVTDRLSRVWYWKGPAWYQREVTIPEDWKGKRITLFLERTKNTRVWVDQEFCGWDDTLSAAQVFDVTQAMAPGKHTVTLLIDNAKLPPVGPSHAVDERTQTNWNGVVGKIELRATDPVWIEDIQVYPNVATKEARVEVVVGNITGKNASGKITVACESYNVDKATTFKSQTVSVEVGKERNVIEFIYQPGPEVPLWDEFQAAMLRLSLKLETTVGAHSFENDESVSFGMRNFTHAGSLLKNNGKTVYLRGRLDCANYPLTGYAPMDKAEWMKIFSILKDWGLNHVRFHSWCPPEAAFEAANELGFYLQPEIPSKRSGYKAPENQDAAHWNIDRLDVESTETKVSLYDYAKREGELIFKNYGNHPSFVMFTLGNELGRNPGMFEMVDYFKKTDPRRLYAQGANNVHWNPSLAEGDDFWVTGKVEKNARPVRGAFWINDYPNPHIEHRSPSTMVDYVESIRGIPVPLISHEIGSYQVSPDYRDIPKFNGVLRARNYETFRERIKQAGMLDQAHDFVRASGALAAICYREEVEAALRTRGMGGFQLLDVMDFPGQGTALVGMLNVFMESKGIIEPEQWRQFCSETVPLMRMEKYTWTNDEPFHGLVQIAHYGPADINNASVSVTVSNQQGDELAAMKFPPSTIKRGGLVDFGKYSLSLDSLGINSPEKLTLAISIDGTDYRNSYPLWVYPPKVDTSGPKDVMVTDSYQDEKTRKHLAAGGKVLLLPKLDKLPRSVPGGFMTDYWSPMFAESAKKRGEPLPPGTLGILCDPKAPALAAFPTEYHSNWQWWHLVKNSRPIQFDDTPDNYRPIVQVVDNFVRNSKLGLLAETKVDKGGMLICAIDLQSHQDKPEARQLLHSLLRYLNSTDFSPKTELDPDLLIKLLP